MPGNGPVGGLGRPFGDVDHVRDPVLALPGLPARVPHRPTGPQTPGQLVFQRSAGLHVQRLVDGFGAHLHLRLIGEVPAQPAGDLLRGAALGQVRLHAPTQHQVGRQLRRLRPRRPLVGQRRARSSPGSGPARALRRSSRDTVDGARRSVRRSLGSTRPRDPDGDLLPLRQRQIPALQVPTAPRPDPAGRREQPLPGRTIRARPLARFAQELTGLQAPPRTAGQDPAGTPTTTPPQHSPLGKCCDHRTNPRIPHRAGSSLPETLVSLRAPQMAT